MARFVVLGTAVIDGFAWTAFGLLRLDLAGDFVTAESAVNQVACENARVRHLLAVAEQDLIAIPSGSVDQNVVLARIPVGLVLNLPDVRSVIEHVMHRRAFPFRLVGSVDDSLVVESLDDAFKGAVSVGVELEHVEPGRLHEIRTGYQPHGIGQEI